MREDPYQNQAGNRNGQRQSYNQANWRGWKDIASFYFTHYPEDATEKELWHHIKKFGDVREVFISKNRNKNDRRYGFARFKDVEDVYILERKLDNIIYGGLKMYVNTPKFGRNKFPRTTIEAKRVDFVEQKREEATRPRHLRPSMTQVTYDEVVAGNKNGTDSRRSAGNDNRRHEGSWSSMYLDIPKTGNKWLNDAGMGRLKNLSMFDRVEDDLHWDIGADVSTKYMGDDMVLLLGLTDEKAQQMMEEEKEEGTTPFHSLEKWNPTLRTGYRMTWVNCWGIPLMA